MDKGTHETVQPALVRADSASRIAQSCEEAAEAVVYAGDYAGSTFEDAERQRAMRQQARKIIDALASLAKSAAEAASEAASDVPESLDEAHRMAMVDKSAAESNAAACAARAANFTKAWEL